ncbi:hypothetical protein OSTOST_05021, partial [Ostertagia ostertagi]
MLHSFPDNSQFNIIKPGTGASGVLWGIAHISEDLAPAPRRAAYLDVVTRALGGNGQQPLAIRQVAIHSRVISKELGTPMESSEEYFAADPSSRGSIAVLPPNVDISSLQYLQGVNDHGERILFASAEYSNVSMGLMNGAVLSGKAAGEMVARRLRSVAETDREDNEIANLIRLNDEVAKTTRPLQVSVDSRRTNAPTTAAAFVYNTSTHYPLTQPIEVTTFKHF